MSALPSAKNNSAYTGRIFMKFCISIFFVNLSRKFNFSLKSGKNKGTSSEDKCTFLIMFRSFLLRMKKVWDESCRENPNTILCSVRFFRQLRPLWNETSCRARQATDDNMAPVHCTLDTYGYKHALSEFVKRIAHSFQVAIQKFKD